MRRALCSIPQGKLARSQILALEEALKRNYATHFGTAERLTVVWCEIPRGQVYTEGRVSDVSLAMVEVEDALAQDKREAAMTAMAKDWARIARVRLDDLMITLADSRLFMDYLDANRKRVRPSRRFLFLVGTLFHMWRSRRREGYLAMPANP